MSDDSLFDPERRERILADIKREKGLPSIYGKPMDFAGPVFARAQVWRSHGQSIIIDGEDDYHIVLTISDDALRHRLIIMHNERLAMLYKIIQALDTWTLSEVQGFINARLDADFIQEIRDNRELRDL
jgi:hypothetical protein